jgi:general secretion pathway protein G
MKKAFSLLEIIFVITVVALLGSFMLKNSYGFLEQAHITTLKAEIALIRNALNINKNQRIRKGLSEYPLVLDTAQLNRSNEPLFAGTQEEKLLTHPILATTTIQKEVGKFAKVSATKYYVYISKDDYVEFSYNKNEGTFHCNYEHELCKELD